MVLGQSLGFLLGAALAGLGLRKARFGFGLDDGRGLGLQPGPITVTAKGLTVAFVSKAP